jgi:hypothetical protein
MSCNPLNFIGESIVKWFTRVFLIAVLATPASAATPDLTNVHAILCRTQSGRENATKSMNKDQLESLGCVITDDVEDQRQRLRIKIMTDARLRDMGGLLGPALDTDTDTDDYGGSKDT